MVRHHRRLWHTKISKEQLKKQTLVSLSFCQHAFMCFVRCCLMRLDMCSLSSCVTRQALLVVGTASVIRCNENIRTYHKKM